MRQGFIKAKSSEHTEYMNLLTVHKSDKHRFH